MTTTFDPKALPIGAKCGVERCVAWLKARAVEIEAQVDDDCDGPDADDFCERAAHLRTAARDMAEAFGVEWKQ